MSVTPLQDWEYYDDDTINRDAALEYHQAYQNEVAKNTALTTEIFYLKKMLETKNVPAVFTEKDKQEIVNAVVSEVKSIGEVFKKAVGGFPDIKKFFDFTK